MTESYKKTSMTDTDKLLYKHLQEWIKEMDTEIKVLHNCTNRLSKEVALLVQSNNDNKTLREEFIKKHDDYEIRMRLIEKVPNNKELLEKEIENNKELFEKEIASVKENIDTKIKTNHINNTKNSNNIIWL